MPAQARPICVGRAGGSQTGIWGPTQARLRAVLVRLILFYVGPCFGLLFSDRTRVGSRSPAHIPGTTPERPGHDRATRSNGTRARCQDTSIYYPHLLKNNSNEYYLLNCLKFRVKHTSGPQTWYIMSHGSQTQKTKQSGPRTLSNDAKTSKVGFTKPDTDVTCHVKATWDLKLGMLCHLDSRTCHVVLLWVSKLSLLCSNVEHHIII